MNTFRVEIRPSERGGPSTAPSGEGSGARSQGQLSSQGILQRAAGDIMRPLLRSKSSEGVW